jgi:hypothetical protein
VDPYEELRLLKIRMKRIEAAASGIDPGTRIWTTNEIGNRDTYLANREEIVKAIAEGRVEESEPVAPPAPIVYPPTGIPGLVQRGQDLYESTPLQKEAKP